MKRSRGWGSSLVLSLILVHAGPAAQAWAQDAGGKTLSTEGGATGQAAAGNMQEQAPGTTIPSDSNERAHPAWYQSCRDRVAAAKGHPVDILFVGDSITEGWTATAWGGVKRGATVWDARYAPLHALNFGVGADRTENVLYRLQTMDVQEFAPKVTVLMIGTNNTHDSAANIAAGVKAIVTTLQEMYPDTKIILVSILPNARAGGLMAETNTLIRGYADDRSVFYLDLAAKMPPVGDNWVGLGPDKLHPSEVGYQIWAETMEPLLNELLRKGYSPAASAATMRSMVSWMAEVPGAKSPTIREKATVRPLAQSR